MTKILDVNLIRKWFRYNEITGVLSLNMDRGRYNRHKKGDAVGSIHECGPKNSKKYYLRTNFDGALVYVHRVIWVLVTGEQPDEIDHLDGDGFNNKWLNFRNVPHKVNGKNQKRHITNTSGKGGVTYRKDTGKWRARIMVDDKSINLGSFESKDEAIAARMKAEHEHGFITGE